MEEEILVKNGQRWRAKNGSVIWEVDSNGEPLILRKELDSGHACDSKMISKEKLL